MYALDTENCWQVSDVASFPATKGFPVNALIVFKQKCMQDEDILLQILDAK